MKKNIGSLLVFATIITVLSSCMNARIKDHKEWKAVFDEYNVDGCFEMYDNNKEIAHYYNKERCATRYTPASTFKILNSLIALETSIVPNEQMIIKWDGVKRWNENWNKDLTMTEAFKVSCVPYYQELARRIGMDTYHKYLDTVKYGNMQTGTVVDSFWLNDTLKITADEQVGFLKRMYWEELPGFSDRSQRIVKGMMLQKEKKDYKIYYKTGYGICKNDEIILWVVGFVETIHHLKNMDTKNVDAIPHAYFFALNFSTKDKDKDWQTIRLQVLNKLLATQGLNFE